MADPTQPRCPRGSPVLLRDSIWSSVRDSLPARDSWFLDFDQRWRWSSQAKVEERFSGKQNKADWPANRYSTSIAPKIVWHGIARSVRTTRPKLSCTPGLLHYYRTERLRSDLDVSAAYNLDMTSSVPWSAKRTRFRLRTLEPFSFLIAGWKHCAPQRFASSVGLIAILLSSGCIHIPKLLIPTARFRWARLREITTCYGERFPPLRSVLVQIGN